MRLFYWDRKPNFGDHLNVDLWNHLLPTTFDGDPSSVFIGIGTVLSSSRGFGFEAAKHKIVMGAGAGIGTVPQLDASWRVYCVRGPLTAQLLQLEPSAAVTDPGVLAPLLLPEGEPVPKKHAVAFIPHWSHNFSSWRWVCNDIGVHHIDPQRNAPEVVREIAETELLMTEAMHGAIVADGLGVPWIPTVIGRDKEITEFKWRDWCASVGLEYAPVHLPFLWEYPPNPDAFLRTHTRVTRFVARRALRRARGQRPVLSDRSRLDGLKAELSERLDHFRQDLVAGDFRA